MFHRANEKSQTLRCHDLHDGSELERLDDDDDDDDDDSDSSSDSDGAPAVEQKTTEIKDNTAQDLVCATVLLSCGHEVGGEFHRSLVESLTILVMSSAIAYFRHSSICVS